MKKTVLLMASLSILASSSIFSASYSKVNKECMQEKYVEINFKDLPATVVSSLNDVYPDAVILKIYINKNNEYKITVTLAGGTRIYNLFADADGKWLKKY